MVFNATFNDISAISCRFLGVGDWLMGSHLFRIVLILIFVRDQHMKKYAIINFTDYEFTLDIIYYDPGELLLLILNVVKDIFGTVVLSRCTSAISN